MPDVILGVDLGPRSDWTAIMAVDRYLPEGARSTTMISFTLSGATGNSGV